jgi:CheY-like chemotaxis protein
LIVDDDADFLKALQLWFVKSNFEVIPASNGQIANKILHESERVDLVLTDFMMPERNGLELVRILKEDNNLFDIPIVVMSNNSNSEYRRKAHEMGATAYFLKPDGARALAEKSMSLIVRAGSVTLSTQTTPPALTSSVQAMRSSLLALIRLTAQTDGLPLHAKNALSSAEELVESLFVALPVSET